MASLIDQFYEAVRPLNIPSKRIPHGVTEHYWVKGGFWMYHHFEIPVVATILYVLAIFSIKTAMKNRTPFNLKGPLLLWNIFLASFSIMGAFYTAPLFFSSLLKGGIEHEMCGLHSDTANPWVFLFCLSKLPEFLDTIFIVLRKKKLIFLHWYHHIATMWFCWIAWVALLENGGAFAVLNLIVHSIMYSYYAASIAGLRFPQPIRMSITLLQIIQMFLGTIIVVYNMYVCPYHPMVNYLGLGMYISYAVLFLNFFVQNYMKRKRN
eukprot:TRINITY_DN6504_c0_g1_i1.p1 TRINITY_DN6504_c0_g1~~TRINITY_DN6504_c0_g1_i1.p1  ORF type:complete len:265 (-),score=26.75 TRINITY_DN6504_c0_g1_i1:46-840(-)